MPLPPTPTATQKRGNGKISLYAFQGARVFKNLSTDRQKTMTEVYKGGIMDALDNAKEAWIRGMYLHEGYSVKAIAEAMVENGGYTFQEAIRIVDHVVSNLHAQAIGDPASYK